MVAGQAIRFGTGGVVVVVVIPNLVSRGLRAVTRDAAASPLLTELGHEPVPISPEKTARPLSCSRTLGRCSTVIGHRRPPGSLTDLPAICHGRRGRRPAVS